MCRRPRGSRSEAGVGALAGVVAAGALIGAGRAGVARPGRAAARVPSASAEQTRRLERSRQQLAYWAARRVAALHPEDPDLADAVADGTITEADAMVRHPVTVDAVIEAV